jgi:hypothetical protein
MEHTDTLKDAAAILNDTMAVVTNHYIINNARRLAARIDQLMGYP